MFVSLVNSSSPCKQTCFLRPSSRTAFLGFRIKRHTLPQLYVRPPSNRSTVDRSQVENYAKRAPLGAYCMTTTATRRNTKGGGRSGRCMSRTNLFVTSILDHQPPQDISNHGPFLSKQSGSRSVFSVVLEEPGWGSSTSIPRQV